MTAYQSIQLLIQLYTDEDLFLAVVVWPVPALLFESHNSLQVTLHLGVSSHLLIADHPFLMLFQLNEVNAGGILEIPFRARKLELHGSTSLLSRYRKIVSVHSQEEHRP